jgi:hypothetical protein
MNPEVDAEVSPPEVDTEEPAAGKRLDALIENAYDANEAARTAETADGETRADRGDGRTTRGQFAPKKSAADAEATAPKDGATGAPAHAAETTQVADPAQQPVEPPSRWSDADKAAFAKLPTEAKQILVERSKAMEADYTRKTQEVAQKERVLEPLLQKVTPWVGYLNDRGIAASDAFDQFMNVEHTLSQGTPQQKLEAFAYLAKLYNVDISAAQAGGQPADVLSPDWVDPQVSQLGQQVQNLAQALTQMQQDAQARERSLAQAEFASIGAAKDTSGQPKYPHFERVRSRMIKLVAEGDADTWDDAYLDAVYADRELRQQMTTAQTESQVTAVRRAEEERRAEAVNKARGAAPVRTSHGVKGGTKTKGLDAAIEAAIASRGYS